MMRPVGVVWKKDMGAPSSECSSCSCITLRSRQMAVCEPNHRQRAAREGWNSSHEAEENIRINMHSLKRARPQ
jgi:hypothetical protein